MHCAAPTGRNRRCRCCRVAARPGSVRRPPTTHAGNALCARTLPLPRRLGGITTTYASAPDAAGLSEHHGSLGGKSPRGIGSGRVPASPRVGVLRRRSADEARTARCVSGSVLCSVRKFPFTVGGRHGGLSVTRRRCVGSRTAAWYCAGPPRGNPLQRYWRRKHLAPKFLAGYVVTESREAPIRYRQLPRKA